MPSVSCASLQPLSTYLASLINLVFLFLPLEGERDGREKEGRRKEIKRKRERERERTRKCSHPSQKLPSAAHYAEDASAFTSPTVAAAGPLAAGTRGNLWAAGPNGFPLPSQADSEAHGGFMAAFPPHAPTPRARWGFIVCVQVLFSFSNVC